MTSHYEFFSIAPCNFNLSITSLPPPPLFTYTHIHFGQMVNRAFVNVNRSRIFILFYFSWVNYKIKQDLKRKTSSVLFLDWWMFEIKFIDYYFYYFRSAAGQHLLSVLCTAIPITLHCKSKKMQRSNNSNMSAKYNSLKRQDLLMLLSKTPQNRLPLPLNQVYIYIYTCSSNNRERESERGEKEKKKRGKEREKEKEQKKIIDLFVIMLLVGIIFFFIIWHNSLIIFFLSF